MALPTSNNIKAARNYLDWTQTDLAKRCGLSVVSINQIEKGKQEASKGVLENMNKIFYGENIVFLEEGGFRVDNNPVQILYGKDAYLTVQEDIIQTMMYSNVGEILYFGSDEKKSSQEVIKNEIRIYKLGIKSKALVALDDNYFMGNLDTYRLIDKKYFTSNVTVIYDHKVAFNLSDQHSDKKILLIKDEELANAFKEQFYSLWKYGQKPLRTTSNVSYESLAKMQ